MTTLTNQSTTHHAASHYAMSHHAPSHARVSRWIGNFFFRACEFFSCFPHIETDARWGIQLAFAKVGGASTKNSRGER